MLRVEDLRTSYGPIVALDGVSFEVPKGSITAVLGANGAGKTSLLRTLTGLVPRQGGEIELDGESISGLPVEALVHRGMAHVPEGRGVIEELTVEDNLRLGGLFRSRGGRDGLDGVFDRFPILRDRRALAAGTLSGGERQMLVIGRALLAKPRLLLLDEPSLGLAPRIVAQIMGLLRDLRDEEGLTVLLVEQNARSALSVADHGIVLALGKVVAADDPDVLQGDDDLRHAYLGF